MKIEKNASGKYVVKMNKQEWLAIGKKAQWDEYEDEEGFHDAPFADPGGRSALRAGKRIFPCPTCKQPNKLTAEDKKRGYQCDDCADRGRRSSTAILTMNWFNKSIIKIAAQIPVIQLNDSVFKSIQLMNAGKWQKLTDKRLAPNYRMQVYGATEMLGQDVKYQGDKFYVKVFYEIVKQTGEIPYPPGYFTDEPNAPWWGPSDSRERDKKERAYGEPFEKVTTVDSVNGHPFLTFRGMIEGWRPGLAPSQEIDHRESAYMKGLPISVSNPGEPRFDMQRIDGFESLTTPSEVAEFVRRSIDKFYNPGFGNDESEPQPVTPVPSNHVRV